MNPELHLKAVVEKALNAHPDVAVIGIYAGRIPLQAYQLDTSRGKVSVHPVRGPLEGRALLADDHLPRPLVLLSAVDASALGEDAVLRLHRRRLLTLNAWDLLRDRLKFRTVEPGLLKAEDLVHYLLERPGTDTPVIGGVLTEDAAWAPVLRDALGCEQVPDLLDLAARAFDKAQRAAVRALPEPVRRGLAAYLERVTGRAAAALIDLYAQGTLHPVVFGLCCDALTHEAVRGDNTATQALTRLERLTGLYHDAAVCRDWAAAVVTVTRDRPDPDGTRETLLAQADDVLAQVGGAAFARYGRLSPAGLNDLLADAGRALTALLEQPDGDPAADPAVESARARISRTLPERAAALDMAVRLVRYLRTPDPVHTVLGRAFDAYARDGGYVDWARTRLAEGDPVPALHDAYRRLLARVAARREAENRRFARLLAQSSSHRDDTWGMLPIENALDAVVAPLAEAAPVLLLVMDGMSAAVFRPLVADLARHHGRLALVPDGRPMPALCAALPTVTEVSRTALFAGRLTLGHGPDQERLFGAHPGLCRLNGKSGPPRLLLKGALGNPLSEAARTCLADPHQRVVGVVINAVDDRLSKGDQLAAPRRAADIPLLPQVLEAARDAGRLVILTADHGHVPEWGDGTLCRFRGGGERYRPDDGRPTEDEVRMHGPRVLPGGRDEAVILPAVEGLRYVDKKSGYHGGATPPEVVVPLAVLKHAAQADPDGWKEAALYQPAWWSDDSRHEADPRPEALAPDPWTDVADRDPAPVAPAKSDPPPAGLTPATADPSGPTRPTHALEAQPRGGRPASETAASDWVRRLVASPLVQSRRARYKHMVRGLSDDRLHKALTLLERREGRVRLSVMARELDLPDLRIPGFVEGLRTLLNLDGYPVLSIADRELVLDRPLLQRQFALTDAALLEAPSPTEAAPLDPESLLDTPLLRLLNAHAGDQPAPVGTLRGLLEAWRHDRLPALDADAAFHLAHVLADHWDTLTAAVSDPAQVAAAAAADLGTLGADPSLCAAFGQGSKTRAAEALTLWRRKPTEPAWPLMQPLLRRLLFPPAAPPAPPAARLLTACLSDQPALRALHRLDLHTVADLVAAWRAGIFFSEDLFGSRTFRAVRSFLADQWHVLCPCFPANRPVAALTLSTRARNALADMGIRDRDAFLAAWRADPALENRPGMGVKTHRELLAQLLGTVDDGT